MSTLTTRQALALKSLDQRLWNEQRDRFGGIRRFQDGQLTNDELAEVLRLVKDEELPCVLYSGPYGELSVEVYTNDSTLALCQLPQELLLSLGEDHLITDRRDLSWPQRFAIMSQTTHTERNRELCQFFGLPLPKEQGSYSY